VSTQEYKYPPQIYYIAYSLFVSFSLYYLVVLTNIFNIFKRNSVVSFVGKSTMWIYLWHWFVLYLYKEYGFHFSTIFKYLFVFSLSVFITYIQFNFIVLIQRTFRIQDSYRKYMNKIFIG